MTSAWNAACSPVIFKKRAVSAAKRFISTSMRAHTPSRQRKGCPQKTQSVEPLRRLRVGRTARPTAFADRGVEARVLDGKSMYPPVWLYLDTESGPGPRLTHPIFARCAVVAAWR